MLTRHGSKVAALGVVTALSAFAPHAHDDPPAPLRTVVGSPVVTELPLDLDVPPPPTPPPPKPPRRLRAPSPWTDPNMPLVRTPDDEELPAWVPITGRLTVVSACDIAENLGLAPLGTAKKGGCPDAVQLIEQEQEARRLATEAR